jgi:hypothetical protein
MDFALEIDVGGMMLPKLHLQLIVEDGPALSSLGNFISSPFFEDL